MNDRNTDEHSSQNERAQRAMSDAERLAAQQQLRATVVAAMQSAHRSGAFEIQDFEAPVAHNSLLKRVGGAAAKGLASAWLHIWAAIVALLRATMVWAWEKVVEAADFMVQLSLRALGLVAGGILFVVALGGAWEVLQGASPAIVAEQKASLVAGTVRGLVVGAWTGIFEEAAPQEKAEASNDKVKGEDREEK